VHLIAHNVLRVSRRSECSRFNNASSVPGVIARTMQSRAVRKMSGKSIIHVVMTSLDAF